MTKKTIKLQVEAEHAGRRLDLLLAALLPDCSRSHLQKLIKNGSVRCGGVVCTAQRSSAKTGDRIIVEIEEAESRAPVGENIDLPVLKSILWEYEDLLINDGCTGLAVLNPGLPQEVQFDEHKLLIVYGEDLQDYENLLCDRTVGCNEQEPNDPYVIENTDENYQAPGPYYYDEYPHKSEEEKQPKTSPAP